MIKISDKLSRDPDKSFDFDDDDQIKELLVELAIADKFRIFPAGNAPRLQSIVFGHYHTQFILIALYSGYEDQKQNGYRAWCLTKNKFGFEQFEEFCRKVLNPTDARFLSGDVFLSDPGNPAN